MNDRYLYKAKRKHDSKFFKKGEWVEGAYYIEPYTDKCFIIQWNSTGLGFNEFIEVDGESVCQCTGLKDKNGKLIWENDIVELYDRNIDYKWRAVVLFGNPNCEYTWGWQLKPIGECEANTDILCWIDMEESGAFCEVIGSAIDNPELLEVGE